MTAQRKQSNFLGVYLTNPEVDYAEETPYRVSLGITKSGEETQWVYGGFFNTEQAAARAYNVIAIQNLGKDAIINAIGKPTKAMNDDFITHLGRNPHNAQRYKLTTSLAKKLIKEYGSFKTHLDMLKDIPSTPEIEGVI